METFPCKIIHNFFLRCKSKTWNLFLKKTIFVPPPPQFDTKIRVWYNVELNNGAKDPSDAYVINWSGEVPEVLSVTAFGLAT